MEQHKYFTLQEPQDFGELINLLKLRYRLFKSSRLHKLAATNQFGIDLDCYDLCSLHFGLYLCEGASQVPVGYVRMVTGEESRYRDQLFEVSKYDQVLYEHVNRIPEYRYPLMEYAPYTPHVERFLVTAVHENSHIAEASRLCLDPSLRGNRFADFNNARNFVAAIYAASLARGIGGCIVACDANHLVMYRLLGGKIFPGTEKWWSEKAGIDFSLLLLSANNLPGSMRNQVLGMREAFERTGQICYISSDSGFRSSSTPVLKPELSSSLAA
jgi:N-acyl-L-homoserine lactone synthetase